MKPIDADKFRDWAGKMQRRVVSLEQDRGALGLPFPVRVRTEGPLTADELTAKMIRNGAVPAEAAKLAKEMTT